MSESKQLMASAEDYQATLDRYQDSFQESVDDVKNKFDSYKKCHDKVTEKIIQQVTSVDNELVEDLEKINLERKKKESENEEGNNLLNEIINYKETTG